jgi:hypothetical protein
LFWAAIKVNAASAAKVTVKLAEPSELMVTPLSATVVTRFSGVTTGVAKVENEKLPAGKLRVYAPLPPV